jgi:ubiquinone/menaquinone biosynthesis C-methylase UbiE
VTPPPRGGAPAIFTPDYYARLHAVEQAHWYVWGMRRVARALLDAHGFPGAGRALDAGCGTGGTLRWLRTAFPALESVGLDVAAEALQYVRSQDARDGLRVVRGSATALPFGAGGFDLVVSLDVLQHLPAEADDVAALREATRVLRPGGLLLVRAAAVRRGDPPGTRGPDGYHRYRLEELVEKAQMAGLLVRRATPVNWLLSRVEDTRQRFRRPPPGHGDPGLGITPPRRPWLSVGQRLVMCCEARYLARSGRRLPSGHALVLLAARDPEASG